MYGLYPFAPCISTREYYYLLHPFILHLIPPAIFPVDPLTPFESIILSNKFTFDHFRGYMDNLLFLMKNENLTVSTLGIHRTYVYSMLGHFSSWYNICQIGNENNLFDLYLVDMSCVLLLLKDPLTKKQFDTIVPKVLDEK
jgi:hypothetical protein